MALLALVALAARELAHLETFLTIVLAQTKIFMTPYLLFKNVSPAQAVDV
jgi:hypothetical protein